MYRLTIVGFLSVLLVACGCCPGIPENQNNSIQPLRKAVPLEIKFDVKDPWNDRDVIVDSNYVYTIKVSNVQGWRDDDIESDVVKGWISGGGFMSKLIKPMFWLRRNSDEPWYALVGSIRDEQGNDYCFLIGNGISEFRPQASGRLFVYANDKLGHYKNNHGTLDISIELIR
jgi:hypothetical protein